MTSKSREAWLAVVNCAIDGNLKITESAFKKVLDALNEPVRNCDVGTAEEQAKRFNDFCITQRCTNCPLFKVGGVIGECGICWALLPYESEASND